MHDQFAEILQGPGPLPSRVQAVMDCLKEAQPHHHWVGVYWLSGETLALGPFSGPDTDHRSIPVGRGVCGTAVAQGRTQNVPDVAQLDNYLACNLDTRSELVVLIRHPETQEILGQIDIDSTRPGPFPDSEVAEVDAVATLIGSAAAHWIAQGKSLC